MTLQDIKEVYALLVANRPYVGLNSRYTYFLLARDFSDFCVVAEKEGKIVGFSSGYVPPSRSDTFFNWEIVVQEEFRGNGIQKQMLLYQIRSSNAKFLEATINPSNEACKRSITELAGTLNAACEQKLLFSEKDFENDGHENEVLFTIGPIDQEIAKKLAES